MYLLHMITEKQIQDFVSKGYSSQEIEDIQQGLKNIEQWNTFSADDFWKQVYSSINTKMNKNA